MLGLARDLALAHVFGAGHAMDAYVVAFRIPNLLRDLFAEGAMSSAFVPTFTRILTLEGKAAAWRLGNLVVTALLLVTGALVLLGMVFAWPLVTFAASGYAAVPGKLELAVSLARVMFPFLTLIAVAVGFMGMLNSLRRFFVPAFSPAMFNIGTLATMAVLIPIFRASGVQPIYAVAIGTLVGGIGQAAVQWPILRREGFRFRPMIDVRDAGLREVLRLMGPGTMALAAVQINVLVNTMLATSQGEGAASWLNYAFRIMYLPIGLFGLSIATAAIPTLSRDAALGDRDGMRRTVSSALRMMLMLNVPATLGLVALATPIVALIFQHGSFTADATRGHGCGPRLLRARAARILGGQAGRARLLRAPRQPDAGHRGRAVGGLQRRAEPRAGSMAWRSRPRPGHGRVGALQCHRAAVAPAAPARRD